MNEKVLQQLMRSVDSEAAGESKRGVCFHLSENEIALLKMTALAARLTQAGVLRIGLRLAAERLTEERRPPLEARPGGRGSRRAGLAERS